MARVFALLVAVVAMISLALVHGKSTEPPNVEVHIHNNFMDDKFTVKCDSDTKKYPAVHFLYPREVYKFSFNPHIEHRWTCAIATTKKNVEVCGTVHKGEFVLWQINMPAHCHWYVDDYGLWLIQDRKVPRKVLVYKWPASIYGC